ncbi:iron chaperone [Robertmurraya sp. Marseille-Q9965]
METLEDYLAGIDNLSHRERLEEIFNWILEKFPNLKSEIKWNTPMFTDHGTFILGISTAKQHISIAPEEVTMVRFADDIAQAGYSATKGMFRIKWKDQVHYELLEKIIQFNIEDKAGYNNFWR